METAEDEGSSYRPGADSQRNLGTAATVSAIGRSRRSVPSPPQAETESGAAEPSGRASLSGVSSRRPSLTLSHRDEPALMDAFFGRPAFPTASLPVNIARAESLSNHGSMSVTEQGSPMPGSPRPGSSSRTSSNALQQMGAGFAVPRAASHPTGSVPGIAPTTPRGGSIPRTSSQPGVGFFLPRATMPTGVSSLHGSAHAHASIHPLPRRNSNSSPAPLFPPPPGSPHPSPHPSAASLPTGTPRVD